MNVEKAGAAEFRGSMVVALPMKGLLVADEEGEGEEEEDTTEK